jgi:hypothetical protein
MKTNSIFKKAFAMLMVAMVLVSCLATTAFAADTELSCPNESTVATAETKLSTGTAAEKESAKDTLIKNALCKLGYKAGAIKYNTEATDTCKYSTSVMVGGQQTTVYLSVKPSTGNMDVQMNSDGSLNIGGISADDTSAWNQLFSRFKGVIVGLTGVGTMVMIVLFIIQFMKLGSSAGNPQQRSQALTGVLWTGIAAALLGSVTIIVGFFYNAL